VLAIKTIISGKNKKLLRNGIENEFDSKKEK